MTPAGNMVTSARLLGSGMKYETYETDSTKVGNEWCNLFTTALNNLCKPLPILLADSSDTFH